MKTCLLKVAPDNFLMLGGGAVKEWALDYPFTETTFENEIPPNQFLLTPCNDFVFNRAKVPCQVASAPVEVAVGHWDVHPAPRLQLSLQSHNPLPTDPVQIF
jgi:hypothetical protein